MKAETREGSMAESWEERKVAMKAVRRAARWGYSRAARSVGLWEVSWGWRWVEMKVERWDDS